MRRTSNTKQVILSRLREARERAGLSQGEVARMLNMHRPTISEIEAGRRNVSADELARFAATYDVGIGWFFQEGEADARDDQRLRPILAQLAHLAPPDVDKLMQLLTLLREGTNSSAAPKPEEVEWTEEKNARRCELIDRKIQNRITAMEEHELQVLQEALRGHLDQVAPLPLRGATRLHAKLSRNRRRR
jgi:transcriptional regulator with XRE-family HTH domain